MRDPVVAALDDTPAFETAREEHMAEEGGNQLQGLAWFSPVAEPRRSEAAGVRLAGGGVHQSKTMMLKELSAHRAAAKADLSSPATLIIEQNILGKHTASARKLALARLNGLYGIVKPNPISRVLFGLWPLDVRGRPILALLCALARDALLRDTASAVLPAPLGVSVRWPVIAATLEGQHPRRFSENMLRSLSRNCASTWTQSGHLRGRRKKLRVRAQPTATAAAYAALIATVCGFGGPALIDSPWLAVLDRPRDERLSLLRQAEAQGLVRVRTAGDMLEISARQPIAQALRMPEVGDL